MEVVVNIVPLNASPCSVALFCGVLGWVLEEILKRTQFLHRRGGWKILMIKVHCLETNTGIHLFAVPLFEVVLQKFSAEFGGAG